MHSHENKCHVYCNTKLSETFRVAVKIIQYSFTFHLLEGKLCALSNFGNRYADYMVQYCLFNIIV
jgi:hypothetical protein